MKNLIELIPKASSNNIQTLKGLEEWERNLNLTSDLIAIINTMSIKTDMHKENSHRKFEVGDLTHSQT